MKELGQPAKSQPFHGEGTSKTYKSQNAMNFDFMQNLGYAGFVSVH